MIHAEDRHIKIIRKILKKYPYDFYVFGSRVKGTNKPFSDLDLCAMKDIPESIKCHLEEALEESNLPFQVDIIEWNKISKDFQTTIQKQLIPLYISNNKDE